MLMRPLPNPSVMHLISSLRVGGAERLLVSMMTAAEADPAARYVVVIMNDEIDPGFLAALEATRFPVYRLHRRQGHLSPRYLRQILAIASRHGVEVIHTHNEGSRTWGMMAKLMRPSLRLVYTVHAEGIERQIGGLRRTAYLRLIDASVAISGFVEKECIAFGARNVHRIENGVDLAAFRAVAPQPARTTALRLITVARFAHIKGQDILIEALALVRDCGLDVHLTLAGTKAEPAFYDAVVTLIAERGLGDLVTITLDRTDIPTLLADADVFVLPSRNEGFGLVLVEAMAAQLPIIAARTGGAAELVRDGVNGRTFEPGNAGDLAETIMLLADDLDAARRMAAAGHATAERYDIGATVAAHADLYRGLVMQTAARG